WWRASAEGDPPPSGEVVLSTGVPSGVYAQYGQLLRAQLARDLPQVRVTLLPSAGSVENIERLLAGEADFAIATADSLAAHRSHGPAGPKLLACARIYDDYMQLVVPARSPVRSAADLAGLRVGVGQDQSGVQLVTRELLAAAGLDFERDLTAVPEGIHTMPRMLEQGRLDAFFWSGGLPTRALEQLSQRVAIRLVPLGDLMPGLRDHGSQAAYYRAAVVPPDAYPDFSGSKATDTVAVANLVVTTERADIPLTERFTASVIRGRDRIATVVHAAQRVDLRTAIYTQPLPLHPGAERYYRSVKS
ncbi:TAXI family TRAP transporter solute-binding subunit, partial [Streptomyces sp. SM14]